MTSYTCKCKGTKIISNSTPSACTKCPYCTTTLVPPGGTPAAATPHNYVSTVDSSNISRLACSYCGRTQAQIKQLFGGG